MNALCNLRLIVLQLSLVVILPMVTMAQTRTISFNRDWLFASKEFVSQAKVDSFRQLGTGWTDQFRIEKSDAADSGFVGTNYDEEMASLKGKKWQSVTLPHTAFPEPLVIVKPREGLAWYRKQFSLPASSKGKRISIGFEGAMQVSQVWVNGKYMGRFTGGYLPFEVDITPVARFDAPNTIVVKVNNRPNPVVPPGKPVEKLDFIYYSGIYRDVWLHVRPALHISHSISVNRQAGGGVFVTYPEVSNEKALVEVQTHVVNAKSAAASFIIEQVLTDLDGRKVATMESNSETLEAGSDKHFVQQLTVQQPRLWHPDHPHLYRLHTRVKSNGQVIDEVNTRIGIRSFSISPQTGLLINGAPFRITGTNRHQNYPYIGNALPDNASYRDAWLIKAAGMNAVRTGHYPPDPSFLDAADELGILIINCIPGWQYFNKQAAFEAHVMQDIRQTIRRDRNHASILLWEVSLNETYPSADFRCRQAAVARSEWRGSQNFFTSGDSYFTKACWDVPYDDWNGDPGARNNTTYPQNAFLIREYGDYEFGGGRSTTRVLRGAGEKPLLQQAWNLQWEHNKNRKSYPKSIGDLTWAFYDGLAGCVVGIEGWGVADIFRIPKFSYYLYKSQQPLAPNRMQPFASGPVLQVAGYWNDQSDPSKVIVYSNCEEVGLYLNGKLLARQQPDNGPETEYGSDWGSGGKPFDGGNANHLDHPPFTFRMKGFEAGTLRAEGYVAGKVVVSQQLTTEGKPATIHLEPGTHGKEWQAGGDVIFVYARITDKNGTLCTKNNAKVSLKVSGNAELMSPPEVDAEAGIACFLLRSGQGKGVVSIIVEAAGLPATGWNVNLK